MANGRFLSKSISEDFAVASMSQNARELYTWTIPHLDVNGITTAHPMLLKRYVALLPEHTIDTIQTSVYEWETAGLVILYESNGQPAAYFTGFGKNQKLRRDRESASEHDAPPGYTMREDGSIENTVMREDSSEMREDSRSTPLQVQEQVQVEVEVKDQDQAQAKGQEQGQDEDAENDTARQLIHLAYDTVGLMKVPNMRTGHGRDIMVVMFDILEDYGETLFREQLPQLRDRHIALKKAGESGIGAPVQYVRGMLAREHGGEDVQVDEAEERRNKYTPDEYADILIGS